ncbi:MAG: polyprenyl synthetase family protein [bacterium]
MALTPGTDLIAALREAQGAVNDELARLLVGPADPAPRIYDAMRHTVLSGGKRLRPLLCLFAGESLGADRNALLPCAAALELAHVFTLVHDDLPCMDDAALRRGVATVHVAFDETIAVLAGDALLNLTFQVIAREAPKHFSADRAVRAIGYLAEGLGLEGVVGGQVWDIDPSNADEGRLTQTHLMKTAAFFQAALGVGCLLAGGSDVHLAMLAEYAREVGLAFQIKDDILDATASPEQTGKDARDAAQGRTTYVTRYGVEGAVEHMCRHAELAREAVRDYPNAGLLQALAGYVVEREN